MKSWKRMATLMLALVIAVTLLTGCMSLFPTDEEMIRDRLEEFMDACNSGDLDGMLDCLDKTSRKTYSAVFNIGNGIFGGLIGFDITVQDLMTVMFGLSPQEFFEMQVQSVSIDTEETATVTVVFTITDPQTGEKVTQDGLALPMVKESWDWYIDARIDWYALMDEMA